VLCPGSQLALMFLFPCLFLFFSFYFYGLDGSSLYDMIDEGPIGGLDLALIRVLESF
jgi:hypothetical protein